MDGFFFKDKSKKKRETQVGNRSSRSTEHIDPCEVCGLYKGCLSPKMKYTGRGNKEILIIAEAPGKQEDEKGTQLIGEAGQLLREHLEDLGLNLDRDFWKTNSLICRPPANRKPTKKELKLCRNNIENTIKVLKPRFIWLMGGSPVESFFMDRFSDLSINLWRRRLIPDYNHNCFTIPLYHPSYILRNQDEKLERVFVNDLKWASSCINKELPPSIDIDKVKVLLDHDQIVELLERIIQEEKPIVIDYETSYLNSHMPNAEIWTIGVEGYSFGLDHPEVKYDKKRIEHLWKKILQNKQIGKVAHPVKFEDAWSRARFKIIPKGWIHDTLVTQHVVEHRTTSTKLKFQSFVKWGVEDYEKETKKYFSKDPKQKNKLDQMPLKELCKYNAIDTILTKELWKTQEKELARNSDLEKANKLFHDGVLAFCDIEAEGICVNDEWYETRRKEITNQIKKIELDLVHGEDGKKFKEATGRELKITSNKDLCELFFDILKLKVGKTTANDNPSVDVEALITLDTPFCKELLRHRKLIKIRDTYLAQFLRESINGKIYPSFNLHTVDTYRSSSNNPNFQNIPVRDEEAKKETRSGIIPSEGNKLLEIDYSAMEVRIAACYTKDPALIKDINMKVDIHGDQAKLLFLLKSNEIHSDIRFHSKNGFVFPEIYGSYYKNCAINLWEEAKDLITKTGVPLLKHLNSHGISNLEDFIDHVEKVEEAFWKKFPLIKVWQEENEEHYKRKGYIQFLFGHRRSGYLSKNALSNYPIQGAAFHCLLWSVIQLNRKRKEEGWKTRPIGQIHDSIVFDLCPDEQDYVIEVTKRVMTEDIRKEFPFLIVPLDVEAEITDINGSWYSKKEI